MFYQDRKASSRAIGTFESSSYRAENRTSRKSDAGQYLFNEVAISYDDLCRMPSPVLDDVEVARARRLLIKRIIQLAYKPDVLTPRQVVVFQMMMTGEYTEIRMAKELGICQPSVFKTIYGNETYWNHDHSVKFEVPRYHGGFMKKLEKVIKADWIGRYLMGRIGLGPEKQLYSNRKRRKPTGKS